MVKWFTLKLQKIHVEVDLSLLTIYEFEQEEQNKQNMSEYAQA